MSFMQFLVFLKKIFKQKSDVTFGVQLSYICDIVKIYEIRMNFVSHSC